MTTGRPRGFFFGAHWWEVVAAIVGLIVIVGAVKGLLFSDVPYVTLVDQNYPSIDAADKCKGDWVVTEYQQCRDESDPQYEQITSAAKCGTSIVTELVRQEKFAVCENASHGISGYRESRRFEKWSGWRQGGYNEDAWCNDVRRHAEAQIGQPVQWQVTRKDENRKEEFPRRFFYRYYCEGIAHWNPIYKRSRSKNCGIAQPIAKDVRVANTCDDPATRFFPVSRRSECGSSTTNRFMTNSDILSLIQMIQDDRVHSYQCSTCDHYTDGTPDYANCLLTSAYKQMKAGDREGMSKVKSKLAALLSRGGDLTRSQKKRVRNQIKHIENAR